MAVFFEHLDAIRSVLVALWLLVDLEIVSLVVALVLHLLVLDDAHVDVGSRAEIVVDTSLDRPDHKILRLVLSHALPIAILEDSHGGQGSRTHRQEWSSLEVAICGNFNELWALDIVATHDSMQADVASVAEHVARDSSHSHLDAALTMRIESMEFQLALNHPYSFFG